MWPEPSPIQSFRAAQASRTFDLIASLRKTLSRANGNASRNTYIAFDPEWVIAEGRRQLASLWSRKAALISTGFPNLITVSLPDGLPVSIKDCFDLEGFRTSAGSRFYENNNPPAAKDSALAARIKRAGGVITGKTHMHQLAWGITGENRDYGDCLQPDDPTLLTGGSSSGAAASVQEGSALAAIGTDTGGSIRVPAALCGLAGYRASAGVGDWKGGMHLAPTFDTMGWIFRDLRDAPMLAEAIFDLPAALPSDLAAIAASQAGDGAAVEQEPMRVAILEGPLVEPCDEVVRQSMEVWHQRLLESGAHCETLNPKFWQDAWDIYAPIQAAEAARLHRGFYSEFEPEITARLEWGATIKSEQVRSRQRRRQAFSKKMGEIFRRFDFILAPTTPLSRLEALQPQTEARSIILRLTAPASVAGLPALVLPSPGCGLQLLGAFECDRRLLRFGANLGEQVARETAKA